MGKPGGWFYWELSRVCTSPDGTVMNIINRDRKLGTPWILRIRGWEKATPSFSKFQHLLLEIKSATTSFAVTEFGSRPDNSIKEHWPSQLSSQKFRRVPLPNFHLIPFRIISLWPKIWRHIRESRILHLTVTKELLLFKYFSLIIVAQRLELFVKIFQPSCNKGYIHKVGTSQT